MNRKNIIQTIVLLLLLAGLPLGSWYYLREGYNYRKTLINQLQPLGQLYVVELPDSRDSLIRFDDFRGKALVVADIGSGNTSAMETLRSIGEQFAESRAVSVAMLIPSEEAASAQDFFQPAMEEHPGLFYILKGDVAGVEKLRQSLSFSGETNVALADSSLTVRQVYQIGDEKDIRRLIEHLVIVIPPKRSPKPTMKRSIEK